MNRAALTNFGALCAAAFMDYFSFSTSTDGSEQSTSYVSRVGYGSCKVLLGFETTLTGAATLSIAANLQDADDSSGTNVADFGTAYAATVVATGESGGSTENGVVEFDFDLSDAAEYIRFQYTPTLSAGSADTGAAMVLVVLGGAVVEDASATVV